MSKRTIVPIGPYHPLQEEPEFFTLVVEGERVVDIDVQVALPDLGGDTYQSTQLLAPFGIGNPTPTFLSRGVEVVEHRTMGNDNAHLRFKVKQGGTVWDGVGFRLGTYTAEISSRLDIVYNLELDNWGGNERLRLNILDFTPTG